MGSSLTVALELIARSAGMKQGLSTAQNDVSRFARTARREVDALKGSFNSLASKIATMGVSFSIVQQAVASARLDKSLTQIGQTAGGSVAQVTALRSELFRMATQTGQNVEDLQQGFNNLVQSGLGWKESLETIKAINIAMAVTGASAGVLSGGLSVAATAFQFDLSKPGKALELLEMMTVAGRLGNAELQNLSDIFSRVGVNAATAGMSFDKTLAFIEALSMVERQPERLATLADSTLRLFTNLRYTAQAQAATGVKFFDAKGSRRDAFDVLGDIKKKYDTLTTDAQRASFVQATLGHADLDTVKGFRTLLQGDMLDRSRDFSKQIKDAGGTLKKDLPAAVDNAVAQVGRLKGALREAADEFIQPVNKTLANVIAWTMAPKEEGGLGLSGKEMITYGVGGTIATVLAARYGSNWIGTFATRLLKKGGSVAAGVAEGKALEAAAGVTPVFVTNWPAAMNGGILDSENIPPGTGGATKAGKKALEHVKSLGAFGVGALGIASIPLTAGLAAIALPQIFGTGYGTDVEGVMPYADDELARKVLETSAHKPEIRNTVPIVIHQYPDRVYAETPDMNTHVSVDLPRGRF